ncbi:MAG: class I SAM-dependent methyltransferase [Patescibacteria group bacterium]|nr:class I SAM-dependent methyltransferase [Patescibacteria group bacterium]
MKYFKKISEKISDILFNIFFDKFVEIFKKVAFEGTGSNACLKEGYLPVPIGYYSPIPDIADLKKRKVWRKTSTLSGINFNLKEQLNLLKKLGKKYNQECNWPYDKDENKIQFYTNNCSFGFGCAVSLHTVIREFKPQRIVEIGSGISSLVITEALALNQKDKNPCQYEIIDPYPLDFIKEKKTNFNKLHLKRVELMPPGFFEKLEKNDILFIDSGHTVRIGSDVNFLYLDILPRLKPGVMVHIHDIGLPHEYSEVYATQEFFRQFWTEQYLLQAFLIFNSEFEIMLAMNYLMTDRLKDFKVAFPIYNPKKHPYISGSFWLKRK